MGIWVFFYFYKSCSKSIYVYIIANLPFQVTKSGWVDLFSLDYVDQYKLYSTSFNLILWQYFNFLFNILCETIWHMPCISHSLTLCFDWFCTQGSFLVFQNWLKIIWQGYFTLQNLHTSRSWSYSSILSTFHRRWCEQSCIPWAGMQNKLFLSWTPLRFSVLKFQMIFDIAGFLMWKLCEKHNSVNMAMNEKKKKKLRIFLKISQKCWSKKSCSQRCDLTAFLCIDHRTAGVGRHLWKSFV